VGLLRPHHELKAGRVIEANGPRILGEYPEGNRRETSLDQPRASR